MADFKFLGDPAAFGQPVLQIRLHNKTLGRLTYSPPDGVSWKVNDVLSNITCPRCIRQLTADPRFVQV
jgi:hypothetical protein